MTLVEQNSFIIGNYMVDFVSNYKIVDWRPRELMGNKLSASNDMNLELRINLWV